MTTLTKSNILFSDYRGRLLEQVTYNPSNDSLLWVDIIVGEVHRVIGLNWSTHQVLKWEGDDSTGCVLLTKDDDEVIVGSKHGLARGNFKNNTLEYFHKFNFENGETLRSNDGYVDPWNNIWIGIMNDFKYDIEPVGKLIRIKPDLTIETMVDLTKISNGTTFSNGHKKFYWTDSLNHIVWEFDYENDKLTHQCTLINTKNVTKTDGEPDGLTLTQEGNIIQAFWGQSKVLKYSPSGEIIEEWILPAQQISSVTIGGKDNNTLFITTAHEHLEDFSKEIKADKVGDLGGYLYAIKINDHGVPKNKLEGY